MNRLELLAKAHAVRAAADDLIKALIKDPIVVEEPKNACQIAKCRAPQWPTSHAFQIDQTVRLADSKLEGVITGFDGFDTVEVRFSRGAHFAPMLAKISCRDIEAVD